MRVLVPFTVLALFGSTAFAQCQPDGGIGFNVNTGDLNSVRCCSGCGWSSCRLGDVCVTLTPEYKSFSSDLVRCSHREHFIIARRLQAIHATYNPASVDDFGNLAGKGIERQGG